MKPGIIRGTMKQEADTGNKAKKVKGGQRVSVNETATWPPRILRQSTYRIGVLGFWNAKPSDLSGVLDDAFARIFADHAGPRLALLSGAIFQGKGWPTSAEEVTDAAGRYGVAALFEAPTESGDLAYRAYTPAGGLLPVKIHQRLMSAADESVRPELISELIAEFGDGGDRTVNLSGLPIGLLICSENNVLVSEPAEGSGAYIRHETEADLFSHVRVIFNGAHTTMDTWGKLEPRFEYLSTSRRWLFYATNCDGASWGRSSLRAYYNGAKIADSHDGPQPECPVPADLVVDDGPVDRFRALRLDIPGHLLA